MNEINKIAIIAISQVSVHQQRIHSISKSETPFPIQKLGENGTNI